ncbi:hypothetical protein [Amycolatopsis sp.]|nr:hypothetical protein [Amycolatopsis sp.]HVV11608.1 hypothetical protein [Amycolatopsis sp.]
MLVGIMFLIGGFLWLRAAARDSHPFPTIMCAVNFALAIVFFVTL